MVIHVVNIFVYIKVVLYVYLQTIGMPCQCHWFALMLKDKLLIIGAGDGSRGVSSMVRGQQSSAESAFTVLLFWAVALGQIYAERVSFFVCAVVADLSLIHI